MANRQFQHVATPATAVGISATLRVVSPLITVPVAQGQHVHLENLTFGAAEQDANEKLTILDVTLIANWLTAAGGVIQTMWLPKDALPNTLPLPASTNQVTCCLAHRRTLFLEDALPLSTAVIARQVGFSTAGIFKNSDGAAAHNVIVTTEALFQICTCQESDR